MPRTPKYASDAERQAAYRQRCLQSQSLLGLSVSAAESSVTPRNSAPRNSAPRNSAPRNSAKADYRRWSWPMQAAGRDLESVGQEMADYFNGPSENWQDG